MLKPNSVGLRGLDQAGLERKKGEEGRRGGKERRKGEEEPREGEQRRTGEDDSRGERKGAF